MLLDTPTRTITLGHRCRHQRSQIEGDYSASYVILDDSMALFGTTYFQLLYKFKQKFCQTDSFCSSLSVQQLLKIN
jgi:hypothetical protein